MTGDADASVGTRSAVGDRNGCWISVIEVGDEPLDAVSTVFLNLEA